ncbi:hypothetical protein [Actinomadura sp. 3N508]|uniref:hypothetical protein n=1 Tax=Actinomadura sp. 3N508 TaxID=3375153 RepID=UPI00378C4D3B
MSRRTVLAPATLLAAVVLALVAMVGAYAPQSHASGPTARIAQTATTLETTNQAAAADGFAIKSFTCSSKEQQGKFVVYCKAVWVGGEGPFSPIFDVPLRTFFNPEVRSSDATRTAEFNFGCLGGQEYRVTLKIRDRGGIETPSQERSFICGGW